MPRFGEKGNTSWTKAAHIKKGTMGFSNEISMSVLDAAKNALDSQQGEVRPDQLGAIKLFTVGSDPKPLVTLPGSAPEAPASDVAAKPEKLAEKYPRSHGKVKAKSREKSARHRKETSSRSEGAAAASKGPKKERKRKKIDLSGLSVKKKEPKASQGKHISMTPRKSMKEVKPEKTMEEKVAARKARRKVERIILLVALAVVFVISIVFGINLAMDNYRVYEGKIAVLDQGVAQMSIADETLAKVNDALADTSAIGTEEALKKMRDEELPQVKLTLQRALSLLDKAEDALDDSRDKELIVQARKGIEARQRMVESASSLIDKLLPALTAEKMVDPLYEELLKVDTKARTNAALLQHPTKENLEQALEGLVTVKESFQSIKEKMQQADKDSVYVNLEVYEKYIDLRVEALSFAEEAISALLDEDLDLAREKQAAYSKADAAAAEWAQRLPTKPSDLVAESYHTAAQSDIDAYEKARQDAGVADAKLRNYYSSSMK